MTESVNSNLDDKTKFGKVLLSSLFKIENLKGLDKGDLTKPSKTDLYPYITRTSQNNGIESYTGFVDEEHKNPAHTFSLGLLQMSLNYQEKEWYNGQFVRRITPLKKFSKNQIIFLQVHLQKLAKSFDPQAIRKINDIFNSSYLELPITANGEPDYDYMDRYVERIEKEYVERIEKYLAMLGYKSLADCQITDEDRRILNADPKMGKFKISNLFNITTGSLLQGDELVKGDIPRISVTTSNNGVLGYYNTENDNKARHESNFISINFFGQAFYHPTKCSVEMKVHILKLADKHILNDKTGLYLTTLLNKRFNNGTYGYGNQLSSSMLKNDNFSIQLPVTVNNMPDYDFMDKYIIAIEKLKVIKLKKYLDTRLDTYKKVISD